MFDMWLSYPSGSNLFNNSGINIALYDRTSETTTAIAQDVSELGGVDVSANGHFVVYAKYSNPDNRNRRATDVYVYDVINQTETRVGISADGVLPDNFSTTPTISDNGRYIAFASRASNLTAFNDISDTSIFVYDTQTKTNALASISSDGQTANNFSHYPRISGSGKYVTFTTGANNLAPDDYSVSSDIFVHELETSTTSLASVLPPETTNVDSNFDSDISDDGRYVTFVTKIWDPINRLPQWQINVRDRALETTTLINKSYDGQAVLQSSTRTRISGDGSQIVFVSQSGNLVPDDSNGIPDLFSYNISKDSLQRLTIESDGSNASLDTDINKSGDTLTYSTRRNTAGNTFSGNSFVLGDDTRPPTGNFCIDTDGDGWGWNGTSSCRLQVITTACIDTDGDGWGWDGVMSCRVGDIRIGNCFDPDGDGWGWDGEKSCRP